MKKFIACMVTTVMMLSVTAAFAAPARTPQLRQDVLSTAGVVQAIDGDRLTVVGEGIFKEIILTVTDTTYIVKGNDGQSTALTDLKQGDAVTAYYGPRLTKSIPPQGTAIALILGTPKDNAIYLQVDSVEQLPNGDVRVLNSNQDSLITIQPDKGADLAQVQTGSNLLVWYQMMALSMPGQATATKATLLPKRAAADIIAHLLAGTVSVGGTEIAADQKVVLVEKNNTVYLPLRAVVEKLGYTVAWDAKSHAILLTQGTRSAQLTIGSQDYGKAKVRVRLAQAPELIDGQTFVPVSFFEAVLDLQVRVLRDHV